MIPAVVIVCMCAAIILIYAYKLLEYSMAIGKMGHPAVTGTEPSDIKVSILIPFRNEGKNLTNILHDLLGQQYPADLFEIICINDHSTDDSMEIIEQIISNSDLVRLIRLPDHQYGKKAAISMGVQEASGDRIIQTDADCRISSEFIIEHVRAAGHTNQAFVAGPVLLRESEGFWNRVENLEFMSLTGSTLGSFLTGKPVMCNGANISYSKLFYLENEKELNKINSPSGDDVFLLSRSKSEGIDAVFLLTEQSVVITEATGSLLAFLRQRIRWGSKARFYNDAAMLSLASVTFLANAVLLGFLIYGLFHLNGLVYFGGFFLIKSLADLFLLVRTAKHFDRKKPLLYFPLVAIFYYFYLVITGVLSLVAGYRWKGRKY